MTRAIGLSVPLAESCPYPPTVVSTWDLWLPFLPLLAPGHKSNFTVTAFVKAGGSLGESRLLSLTHFSSRAIHRAWQTQEP